MLIVNGLVEGQVDITADRAIGVPGTELHTDMNVYATWIALARHYLGSFSRRRSSTSSILSPSIFSLRDRP